MTERTLELLAARGRWPVDEDVWRPALFDTGRDEQLEALGTLLESGEVVSVHDVIDDQLGELVAGRDPRRRWTGDELDLRVRRHLDGRDQRRYGSWAYYPWSRRLVHLLPRDEFREVRANRNRYKITDDERARLVGFRIGIVGLSVGNMAAVTLALEGIGGTFRLADFDELSLSNLNRLRGGVHDLGVNKAVLAARELFEIDPWLDVELYRDGVRPETVDEFLTGGGTLDLLVEECDDLGVKVLIRERARDHRIPVIMDTSDRGLLDIERFDREPGRPILHGLVGQLRAEELRGMTAKEKVPIVLAIVDEQHISTRMAASLPEVAQTISSWPQLASGVALGGAIVADAARRVLLGELTQSGRYYVDPATIVADGHGTLHEPVTPPPPFAVTEEARQPRQLPPEPTAEQTAKLEPDVVRWIATVGTLAPSAHNAQPWRLVWRAAEQVLECHHDPARDLPNLDFEHGATWVAFGALIENICLASQQVGLHTHVHTWPNPADPRLVGRIQLSPDGLARTDPLFAQVASRVTNRRRDGRIPLTDAAASALRTACEDAGARLHLLRDDAALDRIGALMGAGERVGILDPNIHQDASRGFRWTADEVRAHPHGLDVATLELTPTERAGLRLTQQWRVMEFIGRIGGGRGLEDLTRELVASAAAVGLITFPGTTRDSYLRGGRALQRMWLTATALGLALQPITGLPYLFARAERGDGHGLSTDSRAELPRLRAQYDTLFQTSRGDAEALLFRLAHAEPPTARSLRQPIDTVLTFA
ncbi:Rv1355c family protein [Frankia sp. CNm7]|uniref:Rv1355c family protein n=1 Tax=Frankia nepalensis TaxID=1836974 RepID=A0A937RVB8_9ACTN|nr:Rv1355c family protein [Frankia nepalensis]MBL7501699.1 Rv1355c family protein [Frankia nepalensis]MBL7513458.1 Rv1355c family protein [Frankia nepalensis]MBL7520847.1 Rv1355c family protein [Frankia nepalensis]MBL7632546.1 Rv1355c family protein [Frankia nepalensis]